MLWTGGVQRIAIADAELLTQHGFDTDLIFIREVGEGQTYRISTPFVILHRASANQRLFAGPLRVLTQHYNPQRGPLATIDSDLILKHELTRARYDVLIYTDQHAAAFARLGRGLHGGSFVVFFHETGLKDPGFVPGLIDSRAAKGAAASVTMSERAGAVLRAHGIPNVHVIYPGVEVAANSPGFHEKADLAVSVTVWDSGRRPEALLQVARHMTRGRIEIVGYWPDQEYLAWFRQQVTRLGLNDRIEVTSSLTEQALADLYFKAKVSIRFGYDEMGMGMGALESLGHGIPLVVNRGIGVADLVATFKAGVIVNERDPKAVAEVLQRLFDDPGQWASLSQNSTNLGRQLSWNERGRRLSNLVSSVLA